jgi:integrase
MVELTKRLMAKQPDGPLFRGLRGKRPFTRNGIRCRFKRLRQKLPHLKGLIAYAYRHSFATDALVNGVGIAQVAELLGHTSTEMVMRHYSHIAGKVDHMREAAMKAASSA